jgi:hypothetical protein
MTEQGECPSNTGWNTKDFGDLREPFFHAA